jgi:hypothetical protein
MRAQYLVLVVTMILVALQTATAQEELSDAARARAVEEISQGLARMEASRQEIVAKNLTLTASEAEAFWPVYREYRFDVGKIQDRNTGLLLDYADVFKSMDEAAAKPLLKEWFAIREDEFKVKDKYRVRLARVLPADKVLRFFQIDNRLDLAAKTKMAEQVPLVE